MGKLWTAKKFSSFKSISLAENDSVGGASVARFGPIRLADGISVRHALAFVVVAVISVSLFVFINYLQPYLLKGQIRVPLNVLGRVTAQTAVLHEIIVILFVAPIGALSDRIGRRPIFAGALGVLGCGLLFCSEADTLAQLFLARGVFAVGTAGTAATLAAVAADYPSDADRGKFVSLLLVTQQLGVLVLVALIAAKLPHWLTIRGTDSITAGRFTFAMAAAFAFTGALLAGLGLAGRGRWDPRSRLRDTMAAFNLVAAQIRRSPPLMVVMIVAFVARGDSAVMTAYLSLWVVKAATSGGASPSDAIMLVGEILTVSTACGILGALLIGWLTDHFSRLGVLALALVVAGVSNFATLALDGFGHWSSFALVGLISGAEIGVVICGQALLGQLSSAALRGATVGVFGVCGSTGVLILVTSAGFMFDKFFAQAPFVMLGCVNFMVGLAVVLVWLCQRKAQASMRYGSRRHACDR